MSSAVFFQLQSFAIFCLMFAGIYVIRQQNRRRHIQLMSTAMLWDILLILQIEFTRSAIATAVEPLANAMILNIHISIAVSCVILYIAMAITGTKLLSSNCQEKFSRIRLWHKRLGVLTIIMRILTFGTSFFVV